MNKLENTPEFTRGVRELRLDLIEASPENPTWIRRRGRELRTSCIVYLTRWEYWFLSWCVKWRMGDTS